MSARARAAIAAMLLATPAAAAPLQLDGFFNGHLTGAGWVENRKEGTRRSFTATMEGAWTGPHGTVTEDLTYADGETRRLVWTFDRTGPGRYAGHRDDLVGDADITQDGDAVRMVYRARTRIPSGAVLTLSFDDRFTMGDENDVTLDGKVSYLFVTVGSTRMTIRGGG